MARKPRHVNARVVAHRVLKRIATEDAFATLALGVELDRSGLPARERRLATEIVYGVCRHRSRIDRALEAATTRGLGKVNPAMLAILRAGAYQLLFLDRVPDHAAVNDAVSAARRLGGPRLAGFANSVLRRLARQGEPALPPREPALDHVEAAFSLPRWIAERLARQLGDDADGLIACAQALAGPAALAVRVNRLRTDAAALCERLRAEHPGIEIETSPVCPDALLLAGLGDPEHSPSFGEGLWTVQDIGAQLVGLLVGAPEPVAQGERVRILDACAGLGGKSTHLAERFGRRALIHAADISSAKLALCERALERLGLDQVVAMTVDLTGIKQAGGDELAAEYDAVLLDAPCTGLGVLRRHPEAKWRVREADVASLAELQRSLLDAVATRVRPGGVLVYSVCTFTDEEGPAQVRAFLDRHPEFALDPPPVPEHGDGPDWDAVAGATPGTLRTWPHRHQADAFFAARLVRRGDGVR